MHEPQRRCFAQVVRVGLESQTQQADHLAVHVAHCVLEFLERAIDESVVDGVGRAYQRRVVAVFAGHVDQRRHVLGQTRTAVADAGMQELVPDAAVEAHAARHFVDVRTHQLADVRHLVDERDLRGQKCVGGVLDHLGALE